MSLHMLASGALFADPVRRTSSKGQDFATALLRVPVENDEAAIVSLIAFGGVAQSLLAHGKGDAIAVTGRGKLTTWTKDGSERHGLSVTVEALLTPHAIQRKRARVAEATS